MLCVVPYSLGGVQPFHVCIVLCSLDYKLRPSLVQLLTLCSTSLITKHYNAILFFF